MKGINRTPEFKEKYKENLENYWELREEFAKLISEIVPFESERLLDSHWIEYDSKNSKESVLLKQFIRKVHFIIKWTIEKVLNLEPTYVGDKSVGKMIVILSKLPEINDFLDRLGLERIKITEESQGKLRELSQLITRI